MGLFDFWKKEQSANVPRQENRDLRKESKKFRYYMQSKGFNIKLDANAQVIIEDFVERRNALNLNFMIKYDIMNLNIDDEKCHHKYYEEMLNIDYSFSAEEKARFPHLLNNKNNLKELFPQNFRDAIGFIIYKFLDKEINAQMASMSLYDLIYDIETPETERKRKKIDRQSSLIPGITAFLDRNFIPIEQIKGFAQYVMEAIYTDGEKITDTPRDRKRLAGILNDYLELQESSEDINPHVKEFARKFKLSIQHNQLAPTIALETIAVLPAMLLTTPGDPYHISKEALHIFTGTFNKLFQWEKDNGRNL